MNGWLRGLRWTGWSLAAVVLVGLDAGAQTLGRLFSTPQERALLDELREDNKARAPLGSEVHTGQARATSRLTVNGLVTRERGPDFVWINGERVSRNETTSGGIRVQRDTGARVRLILPGDLRAIHLKAGQKMDLETGSLGSARDRDSDAPAGVEASSAAGVSASIP